jgi:hypothetical protein
MGIFGAIMDKLRHHAASTQASGGSAPPQQQAGGASASSAAQQSQQAAPASAQPQAAARPATMQNVDVDAVLSQLASKHGGGGNWRTSIVDLLKLLDLDSSLAARKELAQELDVHAGADGTAEQNIALQKAVMRKLAENGGRVPDELRN